ncbi:hypothetical protein PVAP13_2KG111540 [Panicum virgatum]|uniref:Uncharacterized protein n=1 Tax=Panicum virgatum TaxID=38727 RepID=A0A8T0WX49_PANVG|nr:hypothetical protein PVAP13_2KG111540 [Panicum virgatum]
MTSARCGHGSFTVFQSPPRRPPPPRAACPPPAAFTHVRVRRLQPRPTATRSIDRPPPPAASHSRRIGRHYSRPAAAPAATATRGRVHRPPQRTSVATSPAPRIGQAGMLGEREVGPAWSGRRGRGVEGGRGAEGEREK